MSFGVRQLFPVAYGLANAVRWSHPRSNENLSAPLGSRFSQARMMAKSGLARSLPASSRLAMSPIAQSSQSRARIIDFAQVPPVECPCGIAHRALGDANEFPGTVHRTEITVDALTHYHRQLTETYIVLTAEPGAGIELNGVVRPVSAGTCVRIPPLVRHRGVGRMTVLIICQPKFDAADEWFDPPTSPTNAPFGTSVAACPPKRTDVS